MTIWWCPYVQSSLVLLEKFIFCDLWVLLKKTLLDFVLFYFVLQSQACLLLQVSLAFLICITIIYDEKDNFLVLVLEALVSLHRTVQLQLLWHQCLGHRLGLLWYLMVCIGKKNVSKNVIFEISPKYYILDSFVDLRATWFLLRDSCPW